METRQRQPDHRRWSVSAACWIWAAGRHTQAAAPTNYSDYSDRCRAVAGTAVVASGNSCADRAAAVSSRDAVETLVVVAAVAVDCMARPKMTRTDHQELCCCCCCCFWRNSGAVVMVTSSSLWFSLMKRRRPRQNKKVAVAKKGKNRKKTRSN